MRQPVEPQLDQLGAALGQGLVLGDHHFVAGPPQTDAKHDPEVDSLWWAEMYSVENATGGKGGIAGFRNPPDSPSRSEMIATLTILSHSARSVLPGRVLRGM